MRKVESSVANTVVNPTEEMVIPTETAVPVEVTDEVESEKVEKPEEKDAGANVELSPISKKEFVLKYSKEEKR